MINVDQVGTSFAFDTSYMGNSSRQAPISYVFYDIKTLEHVNMIYTGAEHEKQETHKYVNLY